jgi:hypothetical protein
MSILHLDGARAGNDLREHRAERVPGLREDLAGRPAEGGGMLAADDGGPGVVVDHDEVGPPEHRHRGDRLQHDAGGHRQGGGPSLRRAERAGRPIGRPHPHRRIAAGRGLVRRERDLGRHHACITRSGVRSLVGEFATRVQGLSRRCLPRATHRFKHGAFPAWRRNRDACGGAGGRLARPRPRGLVWAGARPWLSTRGTGA